MNRKVQKVEIDINAVCTPRSTANFWYGATLLGGWKLIALIVIVIFAYLFS